MRVAANDGLLHRWREVADAMTSEDVDMLEAFDIIEPIGVRSLARPLAFIAASLGRFFGDKDAGLPPEEVEQLRAAVAQAPVETDLIRYAEADHGFNRDVGHAYDASAATDARARLDAFLAKHLTR